MTHLSAASSDVPRATRSADVARARPRRLARNLAHSVGLRGGLRWLLGEAERKSGARCRFTGPALGVHDAARVLDALEEALTELVRDGHGRRIDIALAAGDGTWTLTLRRGLEIVIVDLLAANSCSAY